MEGQPKDYILFTPTNNAIVIFQDKNYYNNCSNF